MHNLKQNIIVEKTVKFALQIIELAELLESKNKFVVAKQLSKSGTSIGANVREAQNAESKADFIHKMKIAAKEADETEYWLFLCQNSKNYPNCEILQLEIQEIIKIISKIISSSKSKLLSSKV
jgi:four helix bundle protein